MKTELKDVIHFYLPCQAIRIKDIEKCKDDKRHLNYATKTAFNIMSEWEFEGKTVGPLICFGEQRQYDQEQVSNIKLILRTLSDMTEEEYTHFEKLTHLHNSHICEMADEVIEHGTPEIFAYAIKQGFDLFGLIESGQAIDKTTLK